MNIKIVHVPHQEIFIFSSYFLFFWLKVKNVTLKSIFYFPIFKQGFVTGKSSTQRYKNNSRKRHLDVKNSILYCI
jgi:hypothetical protein